MKNWIILVLAPFILVSCNLPGSISTDSSTKEQESVITLTAPASQGSAIDVETATATIRPFQKEVTPSPQFTGIESDQNGVYMVLPACLATDYTREIVPEQNPGPDSLVFEYNPEYRKIALTAGYPLMDKFWEPTVYIYPVARFVELVPNLGDEVTQMQQILTDHPAEFKYSIPLLPIENAAQVFRAQVSYLNFQNGKGIGFLTEYAQYYPPVNNYDLVYTYQGLTNDGKYWISVFMPVTAPYLQVSSDDPTLPADGVAAPEQTSANYDEVFAAYYGTMIQKLNSTAVDTFTPSLSCIAQFVQSLKVSD
jgi:hypothetical protein